ncbi:thymidylate kinase [Thermoplasmatales archaeon SG8-52-1]|nr:MAG: thymidylate kinase [Thermoplasmatales archaeon SG8-52-1]
MRFIVIDGLDGVGKDTHAQLIKKKYEDKGEKVVVRSHPESDNFFGKNAKKALLGKGKINKFKASIFYMFDVLNSIKNYYKKKNCDTLIIVRYLIGTAYLPLKIAKIGYNFFSHYVPTSKYMFFLDASPNVLFERIKKRKEKEMFETLDELENVRKKSLMLIKNWNIIDTSGNIQDTYLEIEKLLDNLDKNS